MNEFIEGHVACCHCIHGMQHFCINENRLGGKQFQFLVDVEVSINVLLGGKMIEGDRKHCQVLTETRKVGKRKHRYSG